MKDVLHIKWETGYMSVNMNYFFPCTKAKFNKLLKIIELDWERKDELKNTLKNYFQNKISECQLCYEQREQDYRKYTLKAAVTKKAVAEREQSDGRVLSEKEITREKERARHYRMKANECMRIAKNNERSKKKFQELLTLL